ncbi:MAG: ABC transporter permease [Actinomycetota bacterium]|nr:ABC transporter permease [Actinomycetota bacterium]
MTSVAARVLPPALTARRRARYLLERNVLVYRRSWVIVVSGFFEPLFYLFGVGVGIGRLVGEVTGPAGQPVAYAAYVAPALLAASAMNGAVYESTMNIFFKLRYAKVYEAILATPVGPRDIAVGEIMWCQLRGLLYATAFLTVMVALGLVPSPLGVLALPGAVLIGFAFAALGMAATTWMRSWQDFDLVQLVTLALFLFSATFFPLEVYPAAVRPFVQLSPLYHGVALLRSLTLGAVDAALFGHVAFLLALTVGGVVVAGRRVEHLLRR